MTPSELKEIADKLANDDENYDLAEVIYSRLTSKGICSKCLGLLQIVYENDTGSLYLKCEDCGELYE